MLYINIMKFVVGYFYGFVSSWCFSYFSQFGQLQENSAWNLWCQQRKGVRFTKCTQLPDISNILRRHSKDFGQRTNCWGPINTRSVNNIVIYTVLQPSVPAGFNLTNMIQIQVQIVCNNISKQLAFVHSMSFCTYLQVLKCQILILSLFIGISKSWLTCKPFKMCIPDFLDIRNRGFSMRISSWSSVWCNKLIHH